MATVDENIFPYLALTDWNSSSYKYRFCADCRRQLRLVTNVVTKLTPVHPEGDMNVRTTSMILLWSSLIQTFHSTITNVNLVVAPGGSAKIFMVPQSGGLPYPRATPRARLKCKSGCVFWGWDMLREDPVWVTDPCVWTPVRCQKTAQRRIIRWDNIWQLWDVIATAII